MAQPIFLTTLTAGIVAAALAFSAAACAQVASVPASADVTPDDPDFLSVKHLVETYGCIAGYPDGTFRGNRPLTRYEFAAGVNACHDQWLEAETGGRMTLEDRQQVAQLEKDFGPELANLRGRVDTLQGRTAELEEQQFSTTTKLAGTGNPYIATKAARHPRKHKRKH